MKKRILIIAATIIGIALLVNNSLMAGNGNKDKAKAGKMYTKNYLNRSIHKAETELKMAMRKLWEEHITWTRNVIFNIMDDLPGTDQAVARLMKNQEDIGDAIKPYYGEDAGKKLTALLKTHISGAADVLKAAKKDDKQALETANKNWTKNADDISEFLSKANPNWKLADMKKMMHDHLKYTTDEAMARKKKDYDDDVKQFDKVHNEILEMSDMLAEGITRQFPEKFKTSGSMGKND
jgi:hypothetical protein